VLLRIGQCLPVVAETGVDVEIVGYMDAVLHEAGVELLPQLIAADPEVDRLRIALHVGQGQRTEWRGRRVLERERAEDGGAGLAAEPAGGVLDEASADAEVMFSMRPRNSVRELCLSSEKVG